MDSPQRPAEPLSPHELEQELLAMHRLSDGASPSKGGTGGTGVGGGVAVALRGLQVMVTSGVDTILAKTTALMCARLRVARRGVGADASRRGADRRTDHWGCFPPPASFGGCACRLRIRSASTAS